MLICFKAQGGRTWRRMPGRIWWAVLEVTGITSVHIPLARIQSLGHPELPGENVVWPCCVTSRKKAWFGGSQQVFAVGIISHREWPFPIILFQTERIFWIPSLGFIFKYDYMAQMVLRKLLLILEIPRDCSNQSQPEPLSSDSCYSWVRWHFLDSSTKIYEGLEIILGGKYFMLHVRAAEIDETKPYSCTWRSPDSKPGVFGSASLCQKVAIVNLDLNKWTPLAEVLIYLQLTGTHGGASILWLTGFVVLGELIFLWEPHFYLLWYGDMGKIIPSSQRFLWADQDGPCGRAFYMLYEWKLWSLGELPADSCWTWA